MEEASSCKTDKEKEDGKNNTDAAADVDDDKPVSVHGNVRRLSGPTRRSSKANWTEEEDDILRDAVQKHEGKSWKKIAGRLSGRTDVQCLHRWQKVLNPDLVKGPWSKEEDGNLIKLVGRFGEKKWSEIAEQLPGRMGKQCRERWYNHLKPEINKAAWTDEEERILINAHAEYGNKWSILAKLLPGRTENSVKNHWNCSLKKKLCHYAASGSAVNRTRDSTEANQTQKLVEAEEESVSNREPTASGKESKTEIPNDISKTFNDPRQKPSPYTGLCYEPIQREDVKIFLSSGRFPSSESYVVHPPLSKWCMKETCDSYISTISMLRIAAMRYRNMPSIIRKRAFQLLQKGVSAPDNGLSRGAARG